MARFILVTLLVALGVLAAIPGAPPAPARALAAPSMSEGAPTHVVTAVSGVLLRGGPGDDAPTLGLLVPGTPVRALGEPNADSSQWLPVAAPGNQPGWVRLAALTPIADPGATARITLVPEPADPIVGTWIGRTGDAEIVTFFADGAALLTDGAGRILHGAWQRTPGSGDVGTFAFRAAGPGANAEHTGRIDAATGNEVVLDGVAFDRLSAPPAPNPAVDSTPEPDGPAAAATPVAVPPVAEDPFPGITIAALAAGGGHFGAGPDASLSRVTIDPGYSLDYPFPYPVIVAVEAGTLAVDAAAPGVTVTSPPRVDEHPDDDQAVHAGEAVITRQVGDTVVRQRQVLLDPGQSALLGPGGSASAGAGGLRGLRNAGADALVLLLVAVPPPGASWDVERSRGRERVEVAAVPAAVERRRMRPLPCRVAPRTREEVERIVAEAGPPRESRDVRTGRGLPRGEPADRATVAEIARLEREAAGCLAASDWPRWLALHTDRAVADAITPDALAAAFDLAGNPGAGVGPDRAATGVPGIVAITIRDARVLPDGRAGAIVTWRHRATDGRRRDGRRQVAGESVFRIYDRAGDRWLIDEEFTGDFGR